MTVQLNLTAVTTTATVTQSSTDLVFQSDDGAVGSGDVVFKTGSTERVRFANGGNVGIGVDPGSTAKLVVSIPGTGTIAQFQPNGGANHYYHFNDVGFGAVGDDVNLPYIAVENDTAMDIRLKMSVTNAATNLGILQVDSVSGLSTPSLQLKAPTGDMYLQPGSTTTKKHVKVWAQSGMTVSKGDGTGTMFEVNPDLAAIGFYGTSVASRATISGSRSGATVAVLTALLAALGTATGGVGLIIDSTTA